MLKYVLLAMSMAIASPALAQEVNSPPTTQPPQETPTPETPLTSETPVTNPNVPPQQPSTPPPTPPITDQQAQAPSTPPAPTQQPTRRATSPTDVAAVVNQDFATYDTDANGGLSKIEFTAWMTRLRQTADPAFQPQSAEATAWMTAAFSQADADSNQAVNATELTTFLTPMVSPS